MKKSKKNGKGRHGRPTDTKQARTKGQQQSAGRQEVQADGAAATPSSCPRGGGRCVWQEWVERTGSTTAQLMVKIEQDMTKPDEHVQLFHADGHPPVVAARVGKLPAEDAHPLLRHSRPQELRGLGGA